MKLNVYVAVIAFLGILLLALAINLLKKEPPKQKKTVYINDNKLQVEIARSNLEKAKGLSGRTNLEKNEGMLFVYQASAKPSFWMKGMVIPLDFIWISQNKVVEISKDISAQNLPFPKTISPNQKIDMVLEVAAGTTDDLKISVGDKVSF